MGLHGVPGRCVWLPWFPGSHLRCRCHCRVLSPSPPAQSHSLNTRLILADGAPLQHGNKVLCSEVSPAHAMAICRHSDDKVWWLYINSIRGLKINVTPEKWINMQHVCITNDHFTFYHNFTCFTYNSSEIYWPWLGVEERQTRIWTCGSMTLRKGNQQFTCVKLDSCRKKKRKQLLKICISLQRSEFYSYQGHDKRCE